MRENIRFQCFYHFTFICHGCWGASGDLFNLNVGGDLFKIYEWRFILNLYLFKIYIYSKFTFIQNLYLFKIYIYLKFKIIQNISGDLSFKKCLYIEVNSK